MNNLISNVYTIFGDYVDYYNEQRAEKVELGFIGICQDMYVFAGDIDCLFLINNEGGFQIHLSNDEPKTLDDIMVARNTNFWTRRLKDFNFKKFLKWLYKRNTLVKQINWTNLRVIKEVSQSVNKITPFEDEIMIDKKNGKRCGTCVGRWGGTPYQFTTFENTDKPYTLIKDKDILYRFYLPNTKPKTQKEMIIVPDENFKTDFLEKEIKELKSYVMNSISQRRDDEKHLFYYELLLLYRSFNPEIDVVLVDNQEYEPTLEVISFIEHVIKKYAKKNNLNHYKILAEMFDLGFIDEDSRINQDKRQELIEKYSHLYNSQNLNSNK